MEENKRYLLALSFVRGLGPKNFEKLLSSFGSARAAWEATPLRWERRGIRTQARQSFSKVRKEIQLGEEVERLTNLGIKLISQEDPEYPQPLLNISNPPALLFVKGRILPQDEVSLAVVGTRKATSYGRRATRKVVEGLAGAGLTIVSGLALGIDSEAHRATLNVGGRTIAVLGHGLDQVYPPGNRDLAQKIIQNGALISEYPPGMPPHRGNFPQRNRIISGLSLGTLVCEAPSRSGALITAELALEQGKAVFALSGPIFNPNVAGPASLIQEGAKLVVEPSDILNELQIQAQRQSLKMRRALPESQEEKKIAEVLEEPKFLDGIVEALDISASDLLSTLTMMEMKGIVESLGDGRYALKR